MDLNILAPALLNAIVSVLKAISQFDITAIDTTRIAELASVFSPAVNYLIQLVLGALSGISPIGL